jgi:CHAT domain/WD40-like Beta Propeller Repeat
MEDVEYFDFDLLIERVGRRYRARVLDSPAGSTSSLEFPSPVAKQRLENFLLKIGRPRQAVRRVDPLPTDEVKKLGGRLYESVFREQIRDSLVKSLHLARVRNHGLRIRLRLDAPVLADLPWEYLYREDDNRFFSLSERTPIVRYLDIAESPVSQPVTYPIRLLTVISAPVGYDVLDVEEEFRKLRGALGPLTGYLKVERLDPPTVDKLLDALRLGEYQVLHFIGHGQFREGTDEGVLLFENDFREPREVSGEELAISLLDHPSIRLVVLNSCEGARGSVEDPFSGTAQALLRLGIPAVVAMQFEITDEAAITFTRSFYSALASGFPIDSAVGAARKYIRLSGNEIEWGTPVVYMIAQDGRIFDLPKEDERRAREEQEQLAREEQERLVEEKQERERLAREELAREEQERLAEEKQEQERLAREKQERLAREERERLAREERERLAREERERLARRKLRIAIGAVIAVIVAIVAGILIWGPEEAVKRIGEDQLVFLRQGDGANLDLQTMNPDGSETTIAEDVATDRRPSVSPDRTELVLDGTHEGNADLFLINADGTELRRLTDHPADDTAPTWSPDGEQIVFQSDRDGDLDLYLMEPDNGPPTQLTNDPGEDAAPAWSPDGSKIAFQSNREGNLDIWVMNADGTGEAMKLTDSLVQDAAPAWSPDGEQIAFRSDRVNNPEIFVMNADGTEETRLTFDPRKDRAPVWSPDGREIAFFASVHGNYEIFTISAKGEGERQLTDNEVDDQGPTYPQPASGQDS